MKPLMHLITVLTVIGILGCSDTSCEKKKYAEDIILKVETFQTENGRLPLDIEAIGLTELLDSPAFYELKTDTSFVVWYGIGFESMVYDSETKEWMEEG
jgi:hypothetical protein